MKQFYRLTLGVGLDDPALGGPTLGEGDPDPLEYLQTMSAAPVLDQDGTPAPAPQPEPAPRPEPPMKKDTYLPITAIPAPVAARPADRPAARFAPKPTPKPGPNRRQRRAEKARARHAAKV
jgi:hypothetical protein